MMGNKLVLAWWPMVREGTLPASTRAAYRTERTLTKVRIGIGSGRAGRIKRLELTSASGRHSHSRLHLTALDHLAVCFVHVCVPSQSSYFCLSAYPVSFWTTA